MGTSHRSDCGAVPQVHGKPADRVAAGLTKVVLFGGTFDPPHIGHLLMGQLALEQTGADEVWFVPAPAPPHKLDSVHSQYQTRVRMTDCLIHNHPRLKVQEVESHLPQPSYTVDTLRYCRSAFPDVHFLFLLGTDSLAQLPGWHEAESLVQLVDFVVATRTGHPYEASLASVQRVLPGIRTTVIEMPVIDVSSSFIRDRARSGKPLCGVVPRAVMEIWNMHHRIQGMGETAGE